MQEFSLQCGKWSALAVACLLMGLLMLQGGEPGRTAESGECNHARCTMQWTEGPALAVACLLMVHIAGGQTAENRTCNHAKGIMQGVSCDGWKAMPWRWPVC